MTGGIELKNAEPPALWCGTFRRFDFLQLLPKSSLIKKIAPKTKSMFCELEVRNVTGIRMRPSTIV